MLPDTYSDWIQFYGAFLGLLAFIFTCIQTKKPRLRGMLVVDNVMRVPNQNDHTGKCAFEVTLDACDERMSILDVFLQANTFSKKVPIYRYDSVGIREVNLPLTLDPGQAFRGLLYASVSVENGLRNVRVYIYHTASNKPLVLKTIDFTKDSIDRMFARYSPSQPQQQSQAKGGQA